VNRLTRIEIDGYKSLKHVRLDELGAINVLIGANGVGKSNLFSFFTLLEWMFRGELQKFIAIQGAASSLFTKGPKVTPRIDARLEFESKEWIRKLRLLLDHAAPDTAVETITIDHEQVVSEARNKKASSKSDFGARRKESVIRPDHRDRDVREMAGTLSRVRAFHFHDTSMQARVRLAGRVDDNRGLHGDAGNLAAYLHLLKETKEGYYRRIVDTIRQVYPAFADFDLAPDRLKRELIQLEWRERESDYQLGPHQLSDGTLRAIGLITLLLQPEEDLPEIILIDEPELGLHPFALDVFASLVRGVATQRQLFIATQSPALVDLFEPQDIVVAEAGPDGSSFRRLDPERLRTWLDDFRLSELWEKNVLGGRPR